MPNPSGEQYWTGVHASGDMMPQQNSGRRRTDRRSFLRTSSIIGSGLVFGAGYIVKPAMASESKKGKLVPGRQTPNENVDSTYVFPFPNGYSVSVGDWIQHFVALIIHKDDANRFSDITETRVWIGGDPIDDAGQYWDGPFKEDETTFDYDGDDGYPDYRALEWSYTTPPKQPGEYDFSIEVEFLEDSPSGDFSKGDILPTSGTYSVVKGKD